MVHILKFPIHTLQAAAWNKYWIVAVWFYFLELLVATFSSKIGSLLFEISSVSPEISRLEYNSWQRRYILPDGKFRTSFSAPIDFLQLLESKNDNEQGQSGGGSNFGEFQNFEVYLPSRTLHHKAT